MNKLQIYTYQRAVDEISLNQRAKRRQASKYFENGNLKLYIKSLQQIDFMSIIKAWANWQNLLLILGSFVLSRAFVLQEMLPFTFACIAAFGYRDKRNLLLLSLFAVVGSFTVLHGFALGTNILTIAVLSAVIYHMDVQQFKAWWGIPLLTLSVIMVSKSILMLTGEISFYNEMVIILEALIAGILTLVFLVAGNAMYRGKSLENYSFEETTAFIVLGLGLVIGLNGIFLQGLSISSIFCRAGIMLAAWLWGSSGGTMMGVMCGIIPSVSSGIFAQSLGLYAVSGLLAGLFKNMGRLGVIIGFMLGNLALSIFVTEIPTIITGMWETVLACLMFFFLPVSWKESLVIQPLNPASLMKNDEKKIFDSPPMEKMRASMENLALVFTELSNTFRDHEDRSRQKTETTYLNYLFAEISNQFCYHCHRYDSCWGKDFFATSQEVLDVFALAEQNGGSIPDGSQTDFIRRCLYGKEMMNAINYLFDNLRTNEYWKEKMDHSRQLVSRQLKGLSRVIKNLAAGIDDPGYVDLELRKKLFRACRRLKLEVTDITPVIAGKEQLIIEITAPSCQELNRCEREMATAFSSFTGHRMRVYAKNCPVLAGKGKCGFTLSRAHNYKVETGAAQVGKESLCGDSFTITELAEGQQLIALSDGMGVGKNAYDQSQAAVRLLENLLHCGYGKDIALETINSVLFLRSSAESFVTLDMLIIDLYNAEADFIKVASAPTFIKKGKQIDAVTSNSLPIGILQSLDISSEKKSLFPQDMLVMVSDGIVEIERGKTDESWLFDFLQDMDENKPQAAAELIISEALRRSRGKPSDDMTVIVVKIDVD